MKKFELGLLSLCVLTGSYYGSLFGVAVAICVYLTLSGAFEEIKKTSEKKNSQKKEVK